MALLHASELDGDDEELLRLSARTVSEERFPAARVTRSYRYPFALIAWHSGPVGVDIERIEPYDRT